jgi:hypothetical protein
VSEASFDELLEAVRAALHARRREPHARAEQIERALAAYLAAVEAGIARAYAAEHGLKQPPPPPVSAERAAELLLSAVQRLPELQSREIAEPEPEPEPESPFEAEPEPEAETSAWPRLVRAAARAPLVIVGGVSKRERLLDWPARLREKLEWIDTTRQGTHAIGNLERRIRERRLAALVVLEGMLSHRHSDPLIAAARQVGLPHAYAGKGGRASFARALGELETSLAQRAR